MMTSNAYIATDGETVMKVGKANDIERREKQIATPIKYTIACLDEAAAFRVESQLRDYVIEKGGIRHQGTIDWFKFDAQIYEMLVEFATSADAQITPERDLDEEIEELVTYYYRLIIGELRDENRQLLEKRRKLHEEINRLHEQHIANLEALYNDSQTICSETLMMMDGLCKAREREGDLREQIGELKAIIRMNKQRDNDQ